MDMFVSQPFAKNCGAVSIAEASSPVFVVAGSELERAILKSAICGAGLMAKTLGSAPEILGLPRVRVPSVAVIDVSRSETSTFDLQRHLEAERPEMPLIFITGDCDIAMSVRAMKAGAFDVLPKPVEIETFLCVIRDALEHSRALLARHVELDALRERYASLSRREREVMAFVVSGLLNKQVATELGICEVTVKAHRGQMMRKMKASSFAELVRMSSQLEPLGSRRHLSRHLPNSAKVLAHAS